MSKKVNLLVVEDEISIRTEYEHCCKEFKDIYLVGATGNSDEGIEMVKQFQPNAVVLDLELHKGSGNGISFLNQLSELGLPQKPFILVVTNNISRITHDIVRNLGADFVMTKNQLDYNVNMVLRMLSGINLNIPSFAKAGNGNTDEDYVNTQDYRQKLVGKITKELDLIGINPKLKGRDYLRDAIEMICKEKRSNICSEIAAKYHKTDASVERAMQNAINSAWRNTDIETLERHYHTYVNPKKGVPTITEFIYYYADKINTNI